MNTPKDHTNEVEKRVVAIPIQATDCCGFFKVREMALAPKRECWYCAYASFERETTDPHQSGFCKFKK